MRYYARNNIPNYNTITSIPSGHLPSNINTSLAKDWYSAFYTCWKFTSLPDPFYDTSNATNMAYMFFYCRNLITVPNFDTSNVTDISGMFSSCRNLISLPDPFYNTSNATNMVEMFYGCPNLTTIPNFDTSNATNMSWMFRDCYNIKGDLYIESNNVRYASDMFYNCPKYTKNIYCHANTNTYNTIYEAMGNTIYNSNWNCYLKTF